MNVSSPESAAGSSLTLRQPKQSDGAALHGLIAACPPLDLNSLYSYLLLCWHHAQTSVVAEADGVLVGAITAYIPPEQPDTLFVWQVAVAPQQRGHGLGKRMLQHLLQDCIAPRGLHWMETTISPSNTASNRLFTHFALQHDAGCSITTLFDAGAFGESGHEEERLYKIGPWDRAD
ncbi:MAG: diaminobutyrate acetyltransferase [Oxalobacteraceae bacterium]